MSNLEPEKLRQQQTASGFTPDSQQQESDDTVGTGSLKLDSWIGADIIAVATALGWFNDCMNVLKNGQ